VVAASPPVAVTGCVHEPCTEVLVTVNITGLDYYTLKETNPAALLTLSTMYAKTVADDNKGMKIKVENIKDMGEAPSKATVSYGGAKESTLVSCQAIISTKFWVEACERLKTQEFHHQMRKETMVALPEARVKEATAMEGPGVLKFTTTCEEFTGNWVRLTTAQPQTLAPTQMKEATEPPEKPIEMWVVVLGIGLAGILCAVCAYLLCARSKGQKRSVKKPPPPPPLLEEPPPRPPPKPASFVPTTSSIVHPMAPLQVPVITTSATPSIKYAAPSVMTAAPVVTTQSVVMPTASVAMPTASVSMPIASVSMPTRSVMYEQVATAAPMSPQYLQVPAARPSPYLRMPQ
jgi:hypothetical protein